ncbi:MAG: DUF2905 domain-containing protein [Peptococcaceae bacterium]|jgi:Zn-dependent protease with chaperone function|nr:DUF2905 domain-containing protein [Peptococcaceae bacterium]MBQ2034352.1 DUF2905 domain-containing protein [Peptococcaceae bacterium]MBQ2449741.1 DUF2905 domain-containing protein [Peptococcaceae bacterium]MBQ5682510.1 DUF2905 domain-containing protein [Peptococcaceae bacterium]MBQ5703276.1 DUF2905 domain-containing protein [Peptococcaceae bacterium]
MNGTEFGKMLIMLGLGAILIGAVIIILSRFISLGNLPGDIIIKGENGGGFYFPVVSCIVMSVVLSIIMNLFSR